MSTAGPQQVTVSLSRAPAPHVLEQQWRALEAQSDNSYFTSWSWIGCWLQGLEPERAQLLLSATRNGEVVGLGIVLEHAGRRLKLLPSRALYLHATGDDRHDDLAVEHNGLLVHRDGAPAIAAAMYEHLIHRVPGWDRIEMPGLSEAAPLASLRGKDVVFRERTFPSHFVDLSAVRTRGDYLGMLSANTRSQIRRSLKAYGELGAVELSQARDVETATLYLSRLKALHQRHWTARGESGAFANPLFEAFHQRQIHNGVAGGHVQLLRVHAGERDIGYLYNFIHRGQVLFYQSGFDYDLIEKHGRPGLVTHALSIQHNTALGHEGYDFLAGSTRYKESLSSGMRPMVWLSVHRQTAAFRLEERLRRLKRRLLGTPPPVESNSPPGKREAESAPAMSALVLAAILLVQAFVPLEVQVASTRQVVEAVRHAVLPQDPGNRHVAEFL